MTNGLNVNQSVGLFFRDWEKIEEGETLTYNVSLYEDADLDKVRFFFFFFWCCRFLDVLILPLSRKVAWVFFFSPSVYGIRFFHVKILPFFSLNPLFFQHLKVKNPLERSSRDEYVFV